MIDGFLLSSLLDRARRLSREEEAAGVLDAGLGALATFVLGVYAVRALPPEVLGGYAVVYQAILLVGVVPMNLVFKPLEVAAVAHRPARRLLHLRSSLALGAVPALLASFAVALWTLVAPPEVSRDAVRALTLTGIAAAALGPVQAHLRTMLHSAGYGPTAARVSGIRVATVLAVVVLAPFTGIPAPWIPFGALFLADLASLAAGVAATDALVPRERPAERPGLVEVLHTRRWLAWGGLLGPATGFVSAALVARLAGAAALGHAEAARVVAWPVWGLALGVFSVLGPRSSRAAKRRRREDARAVYRTYLLWIAGGGIATLALLGPDWVLNPLSWLLPTAYAVTWLVPVSILARALHAAVLPFRSELLAAGHEEVRTRVEFVGSGVGILVSLTAPWTRSFALPLSVIATRGVCWIGFRQQLRRVYDRFRPTIERT